MSQKPILAIVSSEHQFMVNSLVHSSPGIGPQGGLIDYITGLIDKF
jgi:hypothetical protein